MLHYLKVAHEMGNEVKKDGAATVARMKAMPTEDDCFGAGTIREDGPPAESKGPWDYYKPLASTPANEAFRPVDKGGCTIVRS